MKIFVTGGAGYIGSATAQALIEAGHTVTVYDSLVTGHRAAVPQGAKFIHASLDDSHALAEALTWKARSLPLSKRRTRRRSLRPCAPQSMGRMRLSSAR